MITRMFRGVTLHDDRAIRAPPRKNRPRLLGAISGGLPARSAPGWQDHAGHVLARHRQLGQPPDHLDLENPRDLEKLQDATGYSGTAAGSTGHPR